MRFPSDLSIRLSGPKILIRFAIMAKSLPKKLVIRPKKLVTRFFWHRLSRLSKFYFPAGREVASSRPAGKSNLDSREVFLRTRAMIVILLIHQPRTPFNHLPPWTNFSTPLVAPCATAACSIGAFLKTQKHKNIKYDMLKYIFCVLS